MRSLGVPPGDPMRSNLGSARACVRASVFTPVVARHSCRRLVDEPAAERPEPSTSRPSAIVVGTGTRPLMRPGVAERSERQRRCRRRRPRSTRRQLACCLRHRQRAERRAAAVVRARSARQLPLLHGRGARRAREVLVRCSRGTRVVRARLPQIRCERAGRSFSLYSRPAASSRVFSLLACSPARRSVRRIATANACAARTPTRSGGSGRRRRAGPRMCVFCELFSSHCSSSFPSDVRIFGGVDRAVPRAAAPGQGGGALLAFALACSLCSSGRVSWCGRSWIIVNGVCVRPYPPSTIALCLRWGGVGIVVSRESRVPAFLRCVGDMHARRCVVPWWPRGHQGT